MTTATKPSYVYVTYIATTPEKVWQALTDTDVTQEYRVGPNGGCSRVNLSDWNPGSTWEHQRDDETHAVDITGKVIESAPPWRLVISWARPSEAADEAKHSRVTFNIESLREGLVRLTVLHEDLERDLPMLAGIPSGWPSVLSKLKTLLETGRPFAQVHAAA
jgi:uncharacterized protein YndB with AHSA1/START domain